MLPILIFAVITLVAFGYAAKQFLLIRQKIMLGKEVELEGDNSERWRNVLLVAFGQKKMFKRLVPALFHLFIYVAFLFTTWSINPGS